VVESRLLLNNNDDDEKERENDYAKSRVRLQLVKLNQQQLKRSASDTEK
jgi:hypothetical protein